MITAFDIEKLINDMHNSGTNPTPIFNFQHIRKINTKLTYHDVCNSIAKSSAKSLNGQSEISKLFQELEEGEFFFNFTNNEFGNLTRLIFICKKSLELYKKFNNVFVADCTYSVNK